MRLLGYLNAAFPCGTFRTIEHEEREEWFGEKLRKSKEYETKFGILAFTAALRVKEPNTSVRASRLKVSLGGWDLQVKNKPGVYANTVSSQARYILLEAIDNSQMCKGARLRCMLNQLRVENEETVRCYHKPSSPAYIP